MPTEVLKKTLCNTITGAQLQVFIEMNLNKFFKTSFSVLPRSKEGDKLKFKVNRNKISTKSLIIFLRPMPMVNYHLWDPEIVRTQLKF